jgi:hypothetical protein
VFGWRNLRWVTPVLLREREGGWTGGNNGGRIEGVRSVGDNQGELFIIIEGWSCFI